MTAYSNGDDPFGQLEYGTVALPLDGLRADNKDDPGRLLGLKHRLSLQLRQVEIEELVEEDLEWLLASTLPAMYRDRKEIKDEFPPDPPQVLGFAYDEGPEEARGKPPAICFASTDRALLIKLPSHPLGKRTNEILATICHSLVIVKTGFHFYDAVQLLGAPLRILSRET